jgi:putative ABC transport system ATP-binding protein
LADRVHHNPGELSGGQQQRVAIARALVTDPEIIFADEPTGNLDSTSSLEIMALFQQLNEKGKTIVLVTHEPEIAEYTHRIIKIADGKIISDEVNRQPRVVMQKTDAPASVKASNENN